MSSQFVISSPQPKSQQQSQSHSQPQSQQPPQQCDPVTKKGFLTTVELLWLLCKKATRELGSTVISILDLDNYILKETEQLCQAGRWSNKALGIGWAVSPELYYLILLNSGMPRDDIDKILSDKFNIYNSDYIRERLIRHSLLSEFFERNNSMLKFKCALENKQLPPISYPPNQSPLSLVQPMTSSITSSSTSPSPMSSSQAQQPIYQQSLTSFSQQAQQAQQPTERKKHNFFGKFKKESQTLSISAPQPQIPVAQQPAAAGVSQAVLQQGQSQHQGGGAGASSASALSQSSSSQSLIVSSGDKNDEQHTIKSKDKGNEDRLVGSSQEKLRYFSYEKYEDFKDLIAFGKRVVMRCKTFYDDRGGFEGYYLYVEDAPQNARYPVFLDKKQVKMCEKYNIISGSVVQAKAVPINSAKNVYRIKPGEFIYALTLENIEIDYDSGRTSLY